MVITVSSQTAIAGIPINGKPISFKEAAKQATNVASCNKKFIALIKSASVIDSPPDKTGRKTKVLDVSPGEIGDDQFGPLSDIPTKEELNALVGKKMCASPD
jgi:hypothetical protein